MDTLILICCAIIIVLLIAALVMISKRGGDKSAEEIRSMLEQFSKMREHESSMLMEHSSRQNESTANQLDRLGRNIQNAQELQRKASSERLEKIETDMKELRAENRQSLDKINGIVSEKMQLLLDDKLTKFSQTFIDNIAQLGRNLSDAQEKQRSATEKSLENLRAENQKSLDKINDTVNEKLQKTLDDKISKSFESVNRRLQQVHEGLGEMKTVASGVADLKNVLSNVKTRGIMGEIQLGSILSEILAPEQYGEQVGLVSGSAEKVDFAVKLPGAENGECIYLPIDAKFPGDTYSNLIGAYESGDPAILKEKRKQLESEIVRCAKSIRDKYIIPPYTTNFAIMFLPFEGLYAEVINMGLVERLQRDYNINIAGPSTMAAMLNSLQMGFRTLAIQKKSGEVWKILEAAKKEFSNFEDVLTSARKRLRQADEDLEKLIGTRTNAINRKLRSVSALDSSEDTEDMLDT